MQLLRKIKMSKLIMFAALGVALVLIFIEVRKNFSKENSIYDYLRNLSSESHQDWEPNEDNVFPYPLEGVKGSWIFKPNNICDIYVTQEFSGEFDVSGISPGCLNSQK